MMAVTPFEGGTKMEGDIDDLIYGDSDPGPSSR